MLPLNLSGITVTNSEEDGPVFTIQVPERKEVTFGVDIARLADWLEEEATGQRRLPGVG